MKKFSLELPKFRLEFNYKLVRRRKPLVVEPLVPTRKVVNRKYRSGTLIGKVARHISEHKSARKFLATNMAAIAIISTTIPSFQSTSVHAAGSASTPDETIIQTTNTLTTEKTIRLPLAKFRLNQGFNFFHPGVDLGASVGDAINPMKAGKIIESGYSTDGYGNTVLIDHGQGLTTRYAHMEKIFVKVGDKVTTNDTIGLVGITGHTTGPHLHFEIRINGVAQNPLNYISTN